MSKEDKNMEEWLRQHPPGGEHPEPELDPAAGEELDELFRRALLDRETPPPPAVWEGVRKRLPLNLAVKRLLQYMLPVAAVVVLGMLGILLYYPQPSSTERGLPQPAAPAKQEVPEKAQIPADEEEGKEKRPPSKDKPAPKAAVAESHTMDKSLEEKVKPVELNLNADDGLVVDEERMRALLAPIPDPQLDSALARVNQPEEQQQLHSAD